MAEVISTKRIILISALFGGLGLLLVAALVFFLRLGAKVDDIGASRFGLQVITMPQGDEIYAKREVRGQNFDVVAISKNPKVCESANPHTDLIFKYDANPLTISKSGDTLIVFWTGTLKQPTRAIGNVLVKQARPDTQSSNVGNIDTRNVQLIDIPLDHVRRGTGECTKD
jgi:hypothetical protein